MFSADASRTAGASGKFRYILAFLATIFTHALKILAIYVKTLNVKIKCYARENQKK